MIEKLDERVLLAADIGAAVGHEFYSEEIEEYQLTQMIINGHGASSGVDTTDHPIWDGNWTELVFEAND